MTAEADGSGPRSTAAVNADQNAEMAEKPSHPNNELESMDESLLQVVNSG
jgi:hypothetical protein